MTKKKYAICLWGELRGVQTTINSFYEYLVKPLDADIFIICQQTDSKIDKNINLFDKNIVIKTLYKKFNTKEYFKDINILQKLNKNMLYEGGLQVYLNYKKIADEYGNILETDYDYIILTRTDFRYLFNLPDVIKISQSNDIFWSYEDDRWEGINNNMSIIPSKYIKNYLYSAYNYLTNPILINKIIKNNEEFNCEKFFKFIFTKEKWKIGLLKSNGFISADSIDEKTTSSVRMRHCTKHNMFFKYICQFKAAHKNLKKYKKNSNWNPIIL